MIKCGTYPNTVDDQGNHKFTYSILPHSGDFRNITVPRSYVLNKPFDAVKLKKQEGDLPDNFSFVWADKANVVTETIKSAENGNGIIIRVFDFGDILGNVNLNFGINIKKAYLCDMLENEISELTIKNNSISLKLKNYEIITIKISNL